MVILSVNGNVVGYADHSENTWTTWVGRRSSLDQ